MEYVFIYTASYVAYEGDHVKYPPLAINIATRTPAKFREQFPSPRHMTSLKPLAHIAELMTAGRREWRKEYGKQLASIVKVGTLARDCRNLVTGTVLMAWPKDIRRCHRAMAINAICDACPWIKYGGERHPPVQRNLF